MEPENKNIPEIQPAQKEKIITPQNNLGNGPPDNFQKINTASIYPQASAENSDESMNSSQKFATLTMQAKSKDADRLVCLRVKAVLVVGILNLLGGLYSLFVGLGLTSALGWIVIGIALVQIIMAAILLSSKDHNKVGLILKILLILFIINILTSLGNPVNLVISFVLLMVLIYTYYRVKSLSYY